MGTAFADVMYVLPLIQVEIFQEMLFLLEGEFFTMGLWSLCLGAIGAAVAGIFLANTNLLLTKPAAASLEYLEETDLQTLDEDERTFKAKELWEKNGAEASELSSLKPELERLGVPLYAVVKENKGTEVNQFKPHFKGEVFLDEKRRFYGPHKRRMGVRGLFRLGVLQNFFRAWKKGYQGNVEGEGFILGGVFVIGKDKQGILLEHREKEFGDKANITSVIEAARKIQVQKDE
ncbi:Redox-regulatory protein FAM213A [Acipenser ruthenus]|uniref:Peroxiredoxin-like 2A n=1 Tax=Acipenser ruthenus TaxID=7906 RepID=A0A662YRS9_ACIRT|nr:Redox-regulatory protein FAM213A [Acipenser ruthenus]